MSEYITNGNDNPIIKREVLRENEEDCMRPYGCEDCPWTSLDNKRCEERLYNEGENDNI